MNYLSSAVRQFSYYKQLGEKAVAQLEDAGLFWKPDGEANSIAVIVRHLRGNMLSRWTNFLTEDGEKSWRDRDAEFESEPESREQLMQHWEEGWNCLFGALQSISDTDLERVIYIRNEGHSILEAINRQISHYCYHVGQIVYIARMLKGARGWESLSIPRNASADYNAGKFGEEKGRRHFTDSPFPAQ